MDVISLGLCPVMDFGVSHIEIFCSAAFLNKQKQFSF
jgi:hypothetical protein